MSRPTRTNFDALVRMPPAIAIGRGFDSQCYELAVHFFGEKDPRLNEIAQAIQDTVETFPSHPMEVGK